MTRQGLPPDMRQTPPLLSAAATSPVSGRRWPYTPRHTPGGNLYPFGNGRRHHEAGNRSGNLCLLTPREAAAATHAAEAADTN